MGKVNAPEGWYDAKLVSAYTKETENGSLVLDLEFNVGDDYFYVKEGIFIRNAPSGDAQKDADRSQWLKESIGRLKEVYPEAVVDGKFVLTKLTNAGTDIINKTVRVGVKDNGKFPKAKVYPKKEEKEKISKDDAIKMAARYSRDLAKFGIVIDEPSNSVVAGSAEAESCDIPF